MLALLPSRLCSQDRIPTLPSEGASRCGVIAHDQMPPGGDVLSDGVVVCGAAHRAGGGPCAVARHGQTAWGASGLQAVCGGETIYTYSSLLLTEFHAEF